MTPPAPSSAGRGWLKVRVPIRSGRFQGLRIRSRSPVLFAQTTPVQMFSLFVCLLHDAKLDLVAMRLIVPENALAEVFDSLVGKRLDSYLHISGMISAIRRRNP